MMRDFNAVPVTYRIPVLLGDDDEESEAMFGTDIVSVII